MCDFRTIEEIQLDDGTVVPITETKDCTPQDVAKPASLFEPGFYCVRLTGSFHLYNDGKNWLYEHYGEHHGVEWRWPNTVFGYKVTKFIHRPH